jgi:hypothetical protein
MTGWQQIGRYGMVSLSRWSDGRRSLAGMEFPNRRATRHLIYRNKVLDRDRERPIPFKLKQAIALEEVMKLSTIERLTQHGHRTAQWQPCVCALALDYSNVSMTSPRGEASIGRKGTKF